jgi:hypothetical protein
MRATVAARMERDTRRWRFIVRLGRVISSGMDRECQLRLALGMGVPPL